MTEYEKKDNVVYVFGTPKEGDVPVSFPEMKIRSRVRNYLIGTAREMTRKDEIQNLRANLDAALSQEDIFSLQNAVRNAEEFLETLPKTPEYPLNLEMYVTLGYVAATLPLIAIEPFTGYSLFTDACLRISRVMFPKDPPVGIVGLVREMYGKLQKPKE